MPNHIANPNGKDLSAESKQAAKLAKLSYVSDSDPGIHRVRVGKGFAYVDPKGKRVRDEQTLLRIRALAIPPAWEDVWIAPTDRGHIQAVGRDARGRKQYRYHARWREVRDEDKYSRLVDFARALPKIRAITGRHLKLPGLPRARVLAAVVQIMEKTLIRVGNDEYARNNNSYGLTTLRDRHATISKEKLRFEFRGKSGKQREIDLHDSRLARIAKQCQDLPGQELFQYLDEKDEVRDIGSADVNQYLREISGKEFTAKDFRTWAGTVLAAQALREFKKFDSKAQAKRNIVHAIESVAERLGNTRAVCKRCYIHPEVLNRYLEGSLIQTLQQRAARLASSIGKLAPEEAAVLALLQRRLAESKS